jgi:DNA-binding GntR family transcriptional regulator
MQEPSSIEHQPASATIASTLRSEILAGVIAPGVRLRQDGLAARFGTSRIPVREALRQLETEALVVSDGHRGARVAPISLDSAMALRLAVPAMSELDFDHIEGILADYDATDEPARWSAANWAFHTALYAPCGRPTLLAMIEANFANVDRFMRVRLSRTTGRERPQREHRAIVAACRLGDAVAAARLLEAHLDSARKSLAAAMRLGRSA